MGSNVPPITPTLRAGATSGVLAAAADGDHRHEHAQQDGQGQSSDAEAEQLVDLALFLGEHGHDGEVVDMVECRNAAQLADLVTTL